MEMDFLQGKRRIIVATSAFGIGIDVPDIELCIHFNTPISMMDYIQQIGRGGRDGTIRTYCVLFYDRNGGDKRIARSFIKKAAKQSEQAAEFMEQNYFDIEAFINSDKCLVQEILAYCQRQLENVGFRRKGMSFFAGQYTSVYCLNHHITCRFEARQALIYQLVLGLTGENDMYNYSKAVHVYPPFFDITCSAKNYKIAPALTVLMIMFYGLNCGLAVRESSNWPQTALGRISRKKFKVLLGKFRKIGINPITRTDKVES